MQKPIESSARLRLAPLALSVALAIGGCSGEQLGTTNDGLAAGTPVSGGTLGVIGGVALVGVLLGLDDDDDGGVVNSDGTDGGTDGAADGGTDGAADGGTDGAADGGTDGAADGGTDGAADGGTDGAADGGTDGAADGGTDGAADGGTDGAADGGTDGAADGGTDGAADGGTDGTADGGTDGTADGGSTDGGTDGGSTDGGTDGGDSGPALQASGVFATDLNTSEVVADGDPTNPASGIASGSTDIIFNRVDGDAFGSVQLSNLDADRVDIMLGPAGTNGFVAVALEHVGGNRWELPPVLSQQQRDILLQNINTGNLYVLASTDEQPNGVLRRQIISPEVTRTDGVGAALDGSSAVGIVMLNRNTREFAITLNTEGAVPLMTGHLLEGGVADGETVIRDLSQRPSNPARFFAYGTFSEAEVQALDNGDYALDVHDVDGARVMIVPLN